MKSNTVKRFFALFTAVLMLGVFGGCAESGSKIDAEQLSSRLRSEITFKDDLLRVETDLLNRFYPVLDTDLIENAYVYKSASGATAEEIAVFETKTTADVAAVKTAVERRVDDLLFNFEDYVPAEVQKIENAVIVTGGNIVVLVVADDHSAAQAILDEYF